MTPLATRTVFVLLCSAAFAGCAGPTLDARSPGAGSPAGERVAAPARATPLLINGEPVEWDVLLPLLAEAGGGEVVREQTLEYALRRELHANGMTINDGAIEAERARWSRLLGPEVAAETEMSIRLRRGLGPERFRRMLWRNAALRALIDARENEVSDEEVRLALEIRRGARFAASGVVAPDARTALEIAERARTDSRGALAGLWSAALGRGVSPWHAVLSPHDPATPTSLRRALTSTPIGEVSGGIALDEGFGVLLIHAEIPADGVDDPSEARAVRESLVMRKTRLAMEHLAERLVARTPAHALDRSLSWDR